MASKPIPAILDRFARDADMGVGYGFTNGGNPVTLKHSGLIIWMPDCARLRRDGSNEFEGIKPDYLVDWGADQATKTAALLRTLDKLPKP
jgi:hypothetical protein